MARPARNNPNLILSAGTHIVTRVSHQPPEGGATKPAGTVAVIVKSPVDATHAYRVRFLDGHETAMSRRQFSIRKHRVDEGLEDSLNALVDYDLGAHVIYRCVVGSRAFGLAGENSDTDRRGIYLPPADLHWSLYGVPEQLENATTDECYWELQKFLWLALKANPNVLECLYTPLVEHATPLAEELLAMRDKFLSRFVYQTYNGYVVSQFKKLEGDLRNKGELKWKHAMHLIRLLLSGISALREGRLTLDISEQKERLLEIKRGELPWERVDAWRKELHGEFDAAFERSPLPEYPDYESANAFLIRARRLMADRDA